MSSFPRHGNAPSACAASRLSLAKNAITLALIVAGFAAIIATIIAWSRGRFDKRAFWLALGTVGAASLVTGINAWPAFAMQLKTAEPLAPQVALGVSGDRAVTRFRSRCLRACWLASPSGRRASIRRLTLASVACGCAGPARGFSSPASRVWLARSPRRTSRRSARYTIESAWLPWVDALVQVGLRAGPRRRGDDHRAALAGALDRRLAPPPLAGLRRALTIATAGAGGVARR